MVWEHEGRNLKLIDFIHFEHKFRCSGTSKKWCEVKMARSVAGAKFIKCAGKPSYDRHVHCLPVAIGNYSMSIRFSALPIINPMLISVDMGVVRTASLSTGRHG